MKRYFLSVVGLALLGAAPAMAQQPIVPANAPGSVIFDSQLPLTGNSGGGGLFSGGGCCLFGHHNSCVTCVPECYMKQKKVVTYGSVCDTLCLCYFHGGCCLHRSCDSGHCDRPHSVRYLTKKTTTCEEPATKCVPSCNAGGCPVGGAPVGHVSITPMMPDAPASVDRAQIVFPKAMPQR